jgi:aromatic-L-amino-acid/L-tryptophan decarboxylase
MNSEEFRRHGHQVVDWIADYLENVRNYRVLPDVQPGELTDELPNAGPDFGESMETILEDFERQIVPATTHWNHPRFMAYFSISGSGPGILGEMLTAALNVNGMLWKSSPAATELEQVTLDWLRRWLGLPNEFFGIIYDTASMSSMHAIAAAREMVDPEARTRGNTGNLTLYISEHAHSSIEKGAIALGIGQRNVRKIPVDDAFRMRVDVLKEVVSADERAGKKPFCVVATVGTTSTTSIDPVPEISRVAEQHGMWFHVDAAYGGSAAIVPELNFILNGAARAHSIVTNPHKWLFTPVDLSVFYTREPEILRRAFSLIPEYLRTADDPRAVNLMDYGVQLGRRFRALKLWFVMRYYGREGLSEIIRSHIAYAQKLAAIIRADPDFEVSAPTPFSLVCFRHLSSDERNREIMESVNASGFAFLSHTVLNGQFVIRLAIGNIQTKWEDVEEVWAAVKKAAEPPAIIA